MSKRHIVSVEEFEYNVTNTQRIPVGSGLELGACICRPDAAGKFPALLWNDPYRSGSDGSTSEMAHYFAKRGYAFIYLNSRGTGNSDGLSLDEYMSEETQDSCDAIAWLAEQKWCNGNVGMLGASYSGFTSLQVAAKAPSALKAIAPAYFTDRRYTDDCHYKGGCLRGYYDMLTYGLSMVARNALPPFPAAVGEKWSELWKQRLNGSEPYLLKWIEHQTEDDYWASGSVIGHYDKIEAASMLIGGWNDGYLNPPLRVFRALECPKKLLMGPWSHSYPDTSHCGPRIDIHYELLRWWDRWLKEMDNGVDEEPAVQVYIREFEEPRVDRTVIAGSWRMATDLPTEEKQLNKSVPGFLCSGAYTEQHPEEAGSRTTPYLPAACTNGGLWDAGVPFCLPGDQNKDEAKAINFMSPPLQEDLHIFGNPMASLFISSNASVIPIAVRLSEVGPDGSSILVTRGILNATRRHGMDKPAPLPPGEITRIEFHLEATAWKFTTGNRIRVSITGSDFPNVWPTPFEGDITVHWGPDFPSQIALPVWDGGETPAFEFQESISQPRATGVGSAPWQVIHDVLEDQYRFRMGEREFGVSQRDPAVAWANAKNSGTVSWAGCEILSEATGSLTSNKQTLMMNLSLSVYLNGDPYFQKQWSRLVKRELL